jgi:hypothetical protein
MKLFLIDWGEKCNGSRYAIIQARSKGFWDLWSNIDAIGDPSKVRAIEIGNDPDQSLYLELPNMDKNGRMSGCFSQPEWAEKYNKKSYPDPYVEMNPDEFTITKNKTGWFSVFEASE